MGLFSYTSIQFSPRLSSNDRVLVNDSCVSLCNTLDATIDLVFDKPYDFYIEANAKGKTTGRIGPELVIGLTKRNAFKGGENWISTCMVPMNGRLYNKKVLNQLI